MARRTLLAALQSYGRRSPRAVDPLRAVDTDRIGLPISQERTRHTPIYHQLEHRADAHILIACLAYCLQVTLKQRLLLHAPGLTPTAVLEKLAEIKMIDVWIPTVDQRWLILPRYTQPSPDTKLLIEKLKLHLPSQPPPRLVARKESSEIEVQTVR